MILRLISVKTEDFIAKNILFQLWHVMIFIVKGRIFKYNFVTLSEKKKI